MKKSPQPHQQAWTWRAAVIGLALSAFIGFGTTVNIMVIHGSYMAIDFSAAAATFILFVWAFFVNGALGRIYPSFALTAGELKLVATMMLVACAIPTMGLVAQLLPIITAPYYFATPENGWAELVQPHIPTWLAPQGDRVIRDFYEGSPSGLVPWGAWARPLLMWGVFLTALYVVSIAMMVVVRRQWMEHERLVYPLAQLPLAMAERPPDRLVSPFFKSPMMWAGFGVAFLNGSLAALHHYFPVVPSLNPQIAGFPIFKNSEWMVFRLSFPMLGFFYLVHLDVAFSIWFFNVMSLVARGLMKLYNVRVVENLGIYGTRSPVFAHLGMGAMVVLVLAGVWTARHHLKNVGRMAFGRASEADDGDEIMSYRAAVLSILVGTVVMVVWLHATGIPFWATMAFLIAAFALFIGLTRIVAESGMAEAVATTIGSSFVVSSFGTSALQASGLTAFGLTYVWAADIRTFVMASAANGMKVIDGTSGRRRPVFWAMLATVAVTFGVSVVTMLTLGYRYGGINGNDWFFGGGAAAPYDYAANKILYPEDANLAGWLFKGIGALLMGVLMFLRTRFLWFPFHPVGLAIGPVWIMDHIWATVFLAWAIKSVALRWGGIGLYRRGRPFFLGLIAGQFVCNGTWLVIDAITGAKGNRIFWI